MGNKPFVVITHSLGTIVFKKILENAAKGDPRLKSFLSNLKGAVFIGGPNNGNQVFSKTDEEIRKKWGKALKFDLFGEVAVSHHEAIDMLLSSMRYGKTGYYVGMRSKKKLTRLQENFDKQKLNAMTISEGGKMKFGLLELPMVVVRKEDTMMKGYPNVHIPNKNHSEICMVKDKNDPTFIAISEFVDRAFADMPNTLIMRQKRTSIKVKVNTEIQT